jgi:hypothetical protein
LSGRTARPSCFDPSRKGDLILPAKGRRCGGAIAF